MDHPSKHCTPSVFQRSLAAAQAGSLGALGEVLEGSPLVTIPSVATHNVRPDLVVPKRRHQTLCKKPTSNAATFCAFRAPRSKSSWPACADPAAPGTEGRSQVPLAAKRHLAREMQLNGFSSVVEPAVSISPDAAFPGRQLAADEDAAKLARVLVRLPADYQQVIRLRSWDLCLFAAIGSEMSRSAEAARSLWSRAVQRLAEQLESGDGARSR